MSNFFKDTLSFLITSIFDLYLMILTARLILAYSRASYFNPVIRAIITVTQPIVAPIRQTIPNYKNIETSTLLLILVFTFLKILLISMFYHFPGLPSLLLLTLLGSLKIILSVFFYAILLGALFSFIAPHPTPFSEVLYLLSKPVLAPLQKRLPAISGIDWSPIPALLLLQIVMHAL